MENNELVTQVNLSNDAVDMESSRLRSLINECEGDTWAQKVATH